MIVNSETLQNVPTNSFIIRIFRYADIFVETLKYSLGSNAMRHVQILEGSEDFSEI